ncbi:MAG: hypothetical protein ACO1Q7_16915 [Gemmatimonas sp.]
MTRAAFGCFVLSLILAVLLHPRVFYGTGGGGGFINFDGVFFAGQWIAFAVALLAFGLAIASWNQDGSSRSALTTWLPAGCAALLLFLLATGVPHKANEGDWRNRKLGVVEFVRALARVRTENLAPNHISASAFAGEWRDSEGAVYTFTEQSVAWRNAQQEGGYASANCGAKFALRYIERDREALQSNGLSWSEHVNAVYDSAAADSRVPVAELACGAFDRIVFIRATPTEIWRWTNALDLDAIKRNTFVLKRVDGTR